MESGASLDPQTLEVLEMVREVMGSTGEAIIDNPDFEAESNIDDIVTGLVIEN